jgi:hypothetical protein
MPSRWGWPFTRLTWVTCGSAGPAQVAFVAAATRNGLKIIVEPGS